MNIKTSLMGVKKIYCFICLSVCCVVSFTYISGPSDFLLGFYNIDYFAIVHNLPLAFRAERILLTSTTASVLCHAIIAVYTLILLSLVLIYTMLLAWGQTKFSSIYRNSSLKNDIVIIYLTSCCFKLIWFSFICGTQKKKLWTMSMRLFSIQWKLIQRNWKKSCLGFFKLSLKGWIMMAEFELLCELLFKHLHSHIHAYLVNTNTPAPQVTVLSWTWTSVYGNRV